MNKSEFLVQLRAKLAGRMDGEELKNALSYYEEYLEDAGPEREQEVLEELGSPEAVAAQVLGEQEMRDTQSKLRRTSHTGVIVLCAALGVVLIGILAFLILSFVGFKNYTQEPQVSVSAKVEPVEPVVPPVSVTPVVAGETASLEDDNLAVFTKLSIQVSIGQIIVEQGTEYGLYMDWYTNTDDLKYTNENGKLKIWSGKSGGGQNQRGGTVRVTVPEGAGLEWAELSTGLGSIDVGDLSADKLTLFTGLGGCDLRRVVAPEIEAETGLGDINVDLDGAPEDYELDLETGEGSIRVDGEKVKSPYEKNDDAHNSLDCSTGLGDISISFRAK